MQQQNQQQQLGRSPMQPPQQSSYSNSRFNQISQQQQQNSIGLMRSPSNQLAVSQPNLRSQFQQQQQLNNDVINLIKPIIKKTTTTKSFIKIIKISISKITAKCEPPSTDR